MKTRLRLLLLPLWILAACQPSLPEPPKPLPSNAVIAGKVAFFPHTLFVGEDPEEVAAADLNNDGHQDLVVTFGPGQVALFLGDGQGGMEKLGDLPVGQQPEGPELADLNGDGAVDIVIANHETDHLTILLGDGTGGFVDAPNSPLHVDVAPHPHIVKARDMDADGIVDLVVDHRQGQGLLILRGMGNELFESPGLLVPVGGDPYLGMALGDLNDDGRLDLVTPNPRVVAIRLAEGVDPLHFAPASSLTVDDPFAVDLGDFNGDGLLDIAAAGGEQSPFVHLFWGDGTGAFQTATGFSVRLARGAKKMAVGDLNGDGVQEVAIANYHATDVTLLFGGDPVSESRLPGGDHPWGLVFADLNEDGLDDLVVVDTSNSSIRLYFSVAYSP